jgi:phospholipid/cholesterol/gamma-HCH transport system substrate-binding protein
LPIRAGEGMTQAARSALRRVDSVLADNAEPLKSTIANLQVFSEGLARNTGKLDGIVAGLERMTGAGTPVQKITYDLEALRNQGPTDKTIKGQIAIPEPTAVTMLETQRMLFSPPNDIPAFSGFVWADAIPKLLQARLIESFENYDLAHAPLHTTDVGQADFQSDRRQALSDRGGLRSGGSNRIVGANRRQGWKSRRVAFVRREREI